MTDKIWKVKIYLARVLEEKKIYQELMARNFPDALSKTP